MSALILRGPSGLGTSGLTPFRSAPAPPSASEPDAPASAACAPDPPAASAPASAGSVRIPELYCPDARRDDPALGEEVNNRLIAWAQEVGIYHDRIERLRTHQFGRLFMLAHPNIDDPDRLLVAARCGLAEWAVDDHWVDEGEHADPALLTPRIAMAQGVVDPVRLPMKYVGRFEQVVQREPVLRALRSALGHLSRIATVTQVARLRHELGCMFIGYGQEAEWRASGRRPEVWEYLVHRYENAFFPCMVLTDPLDGYELPAAEFADPRVRRLYLTAGKAAVILNDIYSMAKEDPTDTNLPNLIAAEENCTLQEATDRAALIHDELMHSIEMEAAILGKAGSPQLRRFLDGVWDWMGGSRRWHATSARYHDARAASE